MLDENVRKLLGANRVSVLFDLRALGTSIELHFEDQLKAPPEGVYSGSQVEPVLVAGKKYFDVYKNVSTQLTSIEDVKGSIFDETGARVITASQVRNHAFMLSNSPILPYRGIKIAKLLYEHHIDNAIAWRRHASNRLDMMAQHFSGDVSAETVEGMLYDFQTEVNADLNPIVGDHEWHYFHTKQQGATLRVERGEDYRVAYFMERFEKGEIKL